MPTTVVLVRHGETDWNRDNRFQGHADIPLNDAGRAQARALGLELEGEAFRAVYSSPLLRAYETAEILAETFLECIIAPGFSPGALDRLRSKAALRLIATGEWLGPTHPARQFKRVSGGFVVQDRDATGAGEVEAGRVVTRAMLLENFVLSGGSSPPSDTKCEVRIPEELEVDCKSPAGRDVSLRSFKASGLEALTAPQLRKTSSMGGARTH